MGELIAHEQTKWIEEIDVFLRNSYYRFHALKPRCSHFIIMNHKATLAVYSDIAFYY
jgi:hypothetical protein